MRQAIIFKCYDENDLTVRHWNKLRTECQGYADCYLLYDLTGRERPTKFFGKVIFTSEDEYKNSGFVLPSQEKLAELPCLPASSQNIYYNPEYALILAAKWLPEYDYYWTVEHDVWFSSHWLNFFRNFDNSKADFIGTYTDHLRPNNTLGFFPMYWHTYNFYVPDESKRGTFGAMIRYSSQLLDVLEENYRAGRHGFYETIVPTLAELNGLVIEDINQIKSDDYKDMIYTMGTFCGNPNISWWKKILPEFKKHLFHPVREPFYEGQA